LTILGGAIHLFVSYVMNLYNIEKSLHEGLSKREKEILIMIASGKSITDISEAIYLSVKTVSTYRKRILEKLNLKTTTGLIRYAITQ